MSEADMLALIREMREALADCGKRLCDCAQFSGSHPDYAALAADKYKPTLAKADAFLSAIGSPSQAAEPHGGE